MSVERKGWTKGWDLKGATVGFLLAACGLALLVRDDDVLDALPGLLLVAAVAAAVLALAVAHLDARVGDAVSRARTRRRVTRQGGRLT